MLKFDTRSVASLPGQRNAMFKPFISRSSKLKYLGWLILPVCLTLMGCDQKSANDARDTVTSDTNADLSIFSGCYTVSHDEPAQIKVSQQGDDWIMQMKEPKRANRVWDEPEKLEPLPISEVRDYFSIDPNNVDAVLARPDKVLVLAHVKSVYANIDPLLDSEYLSYIYKGANTIYKVECDEVNTDILADPHANIIIDNVNDTSDTSPAKVDQDNSSNMTGK